MKTVLSISLLLLSSISYAEDLSPQNAKQIEAIIQAFKNHNIEQISQKVDYPLTRATPIPEIKTPTEFKARFSQVFDQSITNKIAQSTLKDWSSVGMRGIMFDGGELWLDNVSQTNVPELKIISVNYQSQAEIALKAQLIDQQRHELHSSLKQFKQPDLVFKTKDYLIRIDELSNGKYRYASWKSHQDQSTKPDLVLNNGTITMDGSGGNHYFSFKSGSYTYQVHRYILGTQNSADASLHLYKNKKIIINQEGHLIKSE